MITEDDARQLCRDFFSELDHTYDFRIGPTFCIQISPDGKSQKYTNYACHSCFVPISGMFYTASGFFETPENKTIANSFWNWITGATSPWKDCVSEGVERLYSKSTGFQTGFSTPGRVFDKVDFNFLKNFYIAMRMLNERPYRIAFWDHCVQSGYDPYDSLFLASFLQLKDGKIQKISALATHWPLTDTSRYPFSFDKFKNTNPKHSVCGINGYFRTDKSKSTFATMYLPIKYDSYANVIYVDYDSDKLKQLFDNLQKWKG